MTSTKFNLLPGRSVWQSAVLLAVGFWLSGSLLLDLVVMPAMYASGMMTQPGFASAGYSMFWVFNRLGLLCVAIAFVGLLSLLRQHKVAGWAIAAVWLLLGVTFVLTYVMTPVMSGLAMPLNWLTSEASIPGSMAQMHGIYWVLELVKLGLSAALLVAVGRRFLGERLEAGR
ncbi:hypothetical protein HPC62_20675 [Thermoleptolyngbya sichuanensis A183]|uniref:DUF4149 domain-containing protein n=2 Tax=Oculatellaceae TaxID=2303507 RepID=A0A6M8BE84_9CYAN|nr:hypothetical protein HPC62_20675 [Thermoleptolyngbya sichuanensis A183]